MIVGKQRVNSFMTLDYEFMGTRLMDGSITPVQWTISMDMVVPEKKTGNKVDNEYNATVAFQKISFFLDTNLQNIVIANVTCNEDMLLANNSTNITMYCPGEPFDDLIVRLLHSKLSMLVVDDIIIGDIRIKSSDMSVSYTYNVATGDYNLPETVLDYIDRPCISRDTLPWWSRDDGFCFEFLSPMPAAGAAPNLDLFKDVVDPIDEFYRIIAETMDDETEKEPASIVKVDRWKPKKI